MGAALGTGGHVASFPHMPATLVMKQLLGALRIRLYCDGGAWQRTIQQLVGRPGCGPTTATVVLGNALWINAGIVVNTHVARLSARFGLTRETDPVKIERELIPLFPQAGWTTLSHLMIWHGRRVCDAKKRRCGDCDLNDFCPSAFKL